MAKVCEKWFPMGTYKGQRSPGFYMHPTLKSNLDLLLKNVKKDWDYVIIVSAGGQVRMGKSLIALQICMYWTYELWERYKIAVPMNPKENIVYQGGDLISKGNHLGNKYKNSCLLFDEAGADLEGVKVMKKSTQAVKDFLRECGQYNMLTVLVLPEFFDLPKGIALSRSDFLIDCFVSVDKNDEWERGHFNFYSRWNKKGLYLKGKKDLNYKAHKEDFHGDWDEVYPLGVEIIDGSPHITLSPEEFEAEYRKGKIEALKTREELSSKETRRVEFLKGAIKYMRDNGLTLFEVAEEISKRCRLRMSHMYPQRLIGSKDENDFDEE